MKLTADITIEKKMRQVVGKSTSPCLDAFQDKARINNDSIFKFDLLFAFQRIYRNIARNQAGSQLIGN
jgi:folylpolyglutamate synthase/dihydropteroate synthase